MKPPPFTYHRPRTVDEALEVLARVGDAGKVLAGGQSLVPMLSMRLVAPAHVVDINAVRGLSGVDAGADGVRFGALVRHAALERHAGAAAAQPLLGRALRLVAHGTIRNRGTSVGSIVHADPSAEMPAVLTLLRGSVEAVSLRGRRTVQAAELFVGPLETSLAPDELVVSAWVPASGRRSGTAVLEVARRHGDYAICGVAAQVVLDEDGTVSRARATYVSAGFLGSVLDLSPAVTGARGSAAQAFAGAADLARSQVEVEADIHASAEYRRHLVAVLTARALVEAHADAAGSVEAAA